MGLSGRCYTTTLPHQEMTLRRSWRWDTATCTGWGCLAAARQLCCITTPWQSKLWLSHATRTLYLRCAISAPAMGDREGGDVHPIFITKDLLNGLRPFSRTLNSVYDIDSTHNVSLEMMIPLCNKYSKPTAHCAPRTLIHMFPPSFPLPQIERVRLDLKSAAASRRSSEQEVLHYQWFADLGNTDAARAVGQMLSSGSLRDPQQALRYFRQAPKMHPRPSFLPHMGLETCQAPLSVLAGAGVVCEKDLMQRQVYESWPVLYITAEKKAEPRTRTLAAAYASYNSK